MNIFSARWRFYNTTTTTQSWIFGTPSYVNLSIPFPFWVAAEQRGGKG